MLEYLKTSANKTFTENGAASFYTTQSDCLDFFATIGALRSAPDKEILAKFDRAWAENAELTLKMLFFARDIRGGLGERKVFRTIIENMAISKADSLNKNFWAIVEFGRYDDFLVLLNTPVRDSAVDFLKEQFQKDLEEMEKGGEVSLLAKWLPSINAHNTKTIQNGKVIAKVFGLSQQEYRKSLSKLRAEIRIIENNLREKNYTFDYASQPSKAMTQYRKAFLRNDAERYIEFLEKVNRGEKKLNTGTLYPYEIIKPILNNTIYGTELSSQDIFSIDTTWNAQKDYTNGENALVVVDGSGSMYSYGNPTPAQVAISLGTYFAERNTGRFHNHFITFSENPRLVEIKGNNICEKVKYVSSFNEVADTNIQKVFELILDTAVANSLPQEELPSTIYIISDMEFNVCTKDAKKINFAYAKNSFKQKGYTLPKLVFWNVQSRNSQQPVTMDDKGVVLVSGASPHIFSLISSGKTSAYEFMLDTLQVERYKNIVV